jgi:membrane-associated phospholipid phosphatase
MTKKAGILGTIILVILAVITLAIVKIYKIRNLSNENIFLIVVVLLIIYFIAYALKYIIGDPRPLLNGFGWPSSHAAIAFAFVPIVGINWITIGIASAISIQRMIVKAHSIEQVLSGATLGFVISFIYFNTL